MKTSVHGILLLDKPAGMSSNAALQQVRRLFAHAKAGHTGSLDPMATGLLPVCFGEATRISGLLLDAHKSYEAEASFGQRRDTGDATGTVVAEAALPAIEADTASRLRQAFLGPQQQVPPMYSALKKDGKRLYALARQGKEVARKPREIEIAELQLYRLDSQGMAFAVRCSKGTYIRVLIEDMARWLGSEGTMTALRRTAVGPFTLKQAWDLERLAAMEPEARLACLQPAESALLHHPVLELDTKQAQRLLQGQRFPMEGPLNQTLRARDPEGRFLGLVRINGQGLLQVERLFPHSAGLL